MPTKTRTRKKAAKKKPKLPGKRQTNEKKWDTFCKALASCGVVTDARAAAGVSPSAAYQRYKSHSDFASAWDEAERIATDGLEREARKRAIDGWEEPVYGRGPGKYAGTVEVGTIRKKSDTLLIFLLKGHDPARYSERHDHSIHGPNNGPITFQVTVAEDPKKKKRRK